jgi:hypothetical protein
MSDEPTLKIGPFRLAKSQLEIESDPKPEDWEQALAFLLWIARSHPWWIGDLITFGEARFGQEFYQAISPDPNTADMIGRHAAVAKKVRPSERFDQLSWTHHREVVKLPPPARKEVLQYALDKGIASGKMREAVRAVKQRLKGRDQTPG